MLNVITVVRIVAAASDAAWFGGSGLVTSCKQAALGTLRSILAAFTGQEALVGCVVPSCCCGNFVGFRQAVRTIALSLMSRSLRVNPESTPDLPLYGLSSSSACCCQRVSVFSSRFCARPPRPIASDEVTLLRQNEFYPLCCRGVDLEVTKGVCVCVCPPAPPGRMFVLLCVFCMGRVCEWPHCPFRPVLVL